MKLRQGIFFLIGIVLLPFLTQAQSSLSEKADFKSTSNLTPVKWVESVYNSNSNNTDRFYLNGGYGFGTEGIAALGSLSYQFSGAHLITLRTSFTSGFIINDTMNDIGLLYGRATSEKLYHASLSVGLAIVGGSGTSIFDDDPDVIEDFSKRFGVPLQAELHWRPAQILGLGLTGFANFNSTKTFAGLALTLQVGKLR
jgi:hypothetical protein